MVREEELDIVATEDLLRLLTLNGLNHRLMLDR